MSESDPPAFRMLDEDVEFGPDPDPRPAGRWLGPRGTLAIVVAALVLALSGVAVQLHRSRTADHAAAGSRPAPSSARPGPAGMDNCGDVVPQPIVDQSGATVPTGIRLAIGGSSLEVLDLDHGTFTPTNLDLPAGASVVDGSLFPSSRYLGIADCNSGARIVRVSPDGRLRTVMTDPVGATLLADGLGGIWTARFTGGGTTIGEARLQVTMHRLDRPQEIALGALMYPLALHNRVAYVRLELPGASDRLQAFDLTTRRSLRDLGPMFSAAVTAGRLLWLPQACRPDADCLLLVLDPVTGITAGYELTVPVNFKLDNAVLSSTGRLLAVQVARGAASADEHAVSDVVVVDLFSGSVSAVPHLSVPSGARIGYTFSSASNRLVLALGAGTVSTFYTWAAGQPEPLRTPVQLPGPPPSYLQSAR